MAGYDCPRCKPQGGGFKNGYVLGRGNSGFRSLEMLQLSSTRSPRASRLVPTASRRPFPLFPASDIYPPSTGNASTCPSRVAEEWIRFALRLLFLCHWFPNHSQGRKIAQSRRSLVSPTPWLFFNIFLLGQPTNFFPSILLLVPRDSASTTRSLFSAYLQHY